MQQQKKQIFRKSNGHSSDIKRFAGDPLFETNRRRSSRINVRGIAQFLPWKLPLAQGEAQSGYIWNLSHQGMCFSYSGEPISLGSQVSVSFKLSEKMRRFWMKRIPSERINGEIHVFARVVRCTPTTRRNRYSVGLKFQNMFEEDRKEIVAGVAAVLKHRNGKNQTQPGMV